MLERHTLSATTEAYADTRSETIITLRGKLIETRVERSGGLRTRTLDGETEKIQLTSDLSQTPLPALPQPITDERLAQIHQLARQLFPEHAKLTHRTLKLVLTTHRFEVRRAGQEVQRGLEEGASLEVEWGVKEKNRVQTFRETSARRDWQELLEDLKPTAWLTERIASTLRPAPVWPVPDGDIPIFWSSRAVAKICLPFVRAFEGDRLLEGESLLSHWPKDALLPFLIEESPACSIDHEGQPTKPLLLFDGRRPRALLVDKTLAAAFSVDSTGHARRRSYREKNHVLSWAAEIVSQVEALEGLPEWGLSVRDVDLTSIDPRSGSVHLCLRDARLVHQGVEGEAIEPVTLEIFLVDLLRSWRAFSKSPDIYGQLLYKDQMGYLSELKAPAALSPRVRLPGRVPPQHYW